MRHLLTAQQQESFLPFSSRQSLSCCLSRVAKRSTPKPCGPLYFPSEPCGPFPHFRTAWSSSFPLRTSWFSLFTSEPCGPLFTSEPHGLHFFTSEPRGLLFTSPKLPDPGPLPFPSEPRGSLPFALRTSWFSHLLWSRVVYSFLQSRMVSSFLTQNLVVLPLLWLPRLGLNPSTHLPLQPHF